MIINILNEINLNKYINVAQERQANNEKAAVMFYKNRDTHPHN